jgi:hypothetical protein
LVTPDSPLCLQDFESPPQGLSADTNLCGQDTLRRESLPFFEGAFIEQIAKLHKGEVRAVWQRLWLRHRMNQFEPIVLRA